MNVKDSNGALLADGDSVQVIKDLKVKGSSQTLKRGAVFKSRISPLAGFVPYMLKLPPQEKLWTKNTNA